MDFCPERLVVVSLNFLPKPGFCNLHYSFHHAFVGPRHLCSVACVCLVGFKNASILASISRNRLSSVQNVTRLKKTHGLMPQIFKPTSFL